MSYRRVVVTEFGDPNVLKVMEESALPRPGTGEVRVQVLATGVHFTDIMIRKGMYPGIKAKPPFSPGCDMVGVVDAVGDGVEGLIVGQRVAALTLTGACSEYLCLPAERLVPVPAGLDPGEAVAVVLSYVTAYQMLHRVAGISEGGHILVHGGGGAVGTALLQLGALQGLEMFATDDSSKQELLAGMGATPIDYLGEDFVTVVRDRAGDGVDAVFDPIGGEHFRRSLACLRRGGTLVAFGFYNAVMGDQGSTAIPIDVARLLLRKLIPDGRTTRLYSIVRWRDRHPDWFREDLSELFRLLSDGRIRPAIEKRMPMLEALHAHELLEQGGVQGRIVLMAGDDRQGDLSLTFGPEVTKSANL